MDFLQEVKEFEAEIQKLAHKYPRDILLIPPPLLIACSHQDSYSYPDPSQGFIEGGTWDFPLSRKSPPPPTKIS